MSFNIGFFSISKRSLISRQCLLFLLFSILCVPLESFQQQNTIQADSSTEVQLLHGRIRGFVDELNRIGLNVYYGVPFAQAPVGELRFRPPQPLRVPSWTKTRDFIKLSAGCAQSLSYVQFQQFAGTGYIPYSEDCLYLNIWAPKSDSGHYNNRQVLFFLPGGALLFNSASELKYFDGKALAATTNSIVVTANYRLGIFGFLYGNNPKYPGNVGFLDQVLSLQWVHQNIQKFGGDPDKVTIFGESAGAWSVGLHLLRSSSTELFHRATMMSGSPLNPLLGEAAKKASQKLPIIAQRLNCSFESSKNSINGNDELEIDDLFQKCLQSASTDQLLHLQFDQLIINVSRNSYRLAFQPVYGGHATFLPDSPMNLLRSLSQTGRPIPLLIGTLSNEGQDTWTLWKRSFVEEPAEPRTKQQFEQAARDYLTSTLPDAEQLPIDELVYTYFAGVFDEGGKSHTFGQEELKSSNDINYQAQGALYQLLSDLVFTCPSQLFGRHWYKSGRGQVFAYKITYESTSIGSRQYAPWCDQTRFGPCHMLDLQYVFGRPFVYPTLYSNQDKGMSALFMAEVANFGESENASWPPYRFVPGSHKVFVIPLQANLNPSRGSYIVTNDRYFECKLWNRIVFRR